MFKKLQRFWQAVRRLSGDDAYEQYLLNFLQHQSEHNEAQEPLSREEFFKQWQDKKWKGVKRCC